MKREFLEAELDRALRAEPTPACTDRPCGTCRGCDYGAMVEKKFGAELAPVRPAALPVDAAAGAPFRFGVVYEKTGRFRFLGHNDLVNALQRVFRRAGLKILHSEGFHPKPLMSFGPALPLGMEGKSEFFEFKSNDPCAEADFLERANAAAPPGLRFRSLTEILKGAPSWMERVRGATYTLDLKAEDVERAAGPASRAEALLRLFNEPEIREEFGTWLRGVEIDPSGERLILRVVLNAQKIPRPQDLLRRVLGFEKAVFFMTREGFDFEDDSIRPAIDTNDRIPI